MSEFDYLMNEINKMPHLYHLRISSHDGTCTYEANCKITFNGQCVLRWSVLNPYFSCGFLT